jgi:hypothetical protein
MPTIRRSRGDFLAELERARNAVIDWDIRVDDDRQAVDAAVAQLVRSVEARDQARARLAALLEQPTGAAA